MTPTYAEENTMKKKTIEFWEVTIKCLVQTKNINDEKIEPKDLDALMSLEFDQVDHEIQSIKVE